jgi:hypothetical protein
VSYGNLHAAAGCPVMAQARSRKSIYHFIFDFMVPFDLLLTTCRTGQVNVSIALE